MKVIALIKSCKSRPFSALHKPYYIFKKPCFPWGVFSVPVVRSWPDCCYSAAVVSESFNINFLLQASLYKNKIGTVISEEHVVRLRRAGRQLSEDFELWTCCVNCLCALSGTHVVFALMGVWNSVCRPTVICCNRDKVPNVSSKT